MGTALALVAALLIAAGAWSIYVSTGARRWTADRDPLGEPPVKMAALIAAIVVGVALLSTGGGSAERESAMQQGESESDGLLGGAVGTADAGAATRRTAGFAEAQTPGSATVDERPTPTGASKPSAKNGPTASRGPSYDTLVVRARKAARARGAEIRWYPTLAAEAREATLRRSR